MLYFKLISGLMNYITTIYRILPDLKKNLILYVSFCILNLVNMSAVGQKNDSTEKIISDLREKAISYDRNKDVYKAIEYYNRYLSYKSKDIKLTYRLATLYSDTRDYARATQYYDSVITFNSKKYPLAYYRKGIACMSLEKYDDAIGSFTKFKKYYHSRKDKPGYRKLALIYSASSTWAKNNKATEAKIIVTHPDDALNHTDIDFSPFPVDDKNLIYGATVTEGDYQKNPVRQLFNAQMIAGKWKNTGMLDSAINNPEFNTGNAVLSDDGNSLYFTRSRKNWQNKLISEIFVSRLNEGRWQTAEKLPYPVNREDFTTTQPAIGKNLRNGNTVLYFVSDRPGGKGGMDIWYAEFDRKTNAFKKEINLNNKINSPGDECSPFFDTATQTLYFSSRGRKNGLGGYDIFKTTGSGLKWTEPVPLPRPVNSPFDDYYFSILKNNKEGFFTSNRPGTMTLENGTCCDDIFSFKLNDCAGIYSRGTVRNEVNYEFYKTLNQKYHLGLILPEDKSAIAGVPVELYLSDEKENDAILISKTSTGNDGSFSFGLDPDRNYTVLVKNFGYLEKKLAVNTLNKNCADTIDIGTALIRYLPPVTIRINIFYEFDKYRLSDSAGMTIDKLVLPLFDMFPSAIIEIGSHTDSVGTELYNMKLSQKRSETIVSYLVSKGISGERLVAKGYGMSMPVAPNTNKDGSDNPAGRQQNRRTEIKIVGEIPTFNNKE
jgi:outer membrane protein OmpA-like peptidoglycan-associated protein/tetratricopeptide (TPR) repeat protein